MIVYIRNVCVSFSLSLSFALFLIYHYRVSILNSIVSSAVCCCFYPNFFLFFSTSCWLLVNTRLNVHFVDFVATFWVHFLDSSLESWYHLYLFPFVMCSCDSLALISFHCSKCFDRCESMVLNENKCLNYGIFGFNVDKNCGANVSVI